MSIYRKSDQHYFVKFPGDFYAADFYGQSIEDVKQQVRDYLKVKRLPAGVEVWRGETVPASQLPKRSPADVYWM